VLVARTHDGDRAPRVLEARLADGAEHQLTQLAAAARPDHEEVGVAGGVEQRPGRQVADHLLPDLGGRIGTEGVGDRGVERSGGIGGPVVGIERGAAGGV
jgi:hypothetical protein